MARTGADALKPSYAQKKRIVAHTGQNGRGDLQQIMVHRGHAFIGHVRSRGFSVVDLRDQTADHAVVEGLLQPGEREARQHADPAPAG